MKGDAAFATTRWTRVLAARGETAPAQEALAELCSAYYAPIVAFLAREGRSDDEAREMAHEFFAQLIRRHGIDGADPARGRFRSYLLGALKHFAANQRLRESRQKRGGEVVHQPWEPPAADSTDHPPGPGCAMPSVRPPPDDWFDRAWAIAVVERGLAALEQEARDAGTHELFEELKPWLSSEPTSGLQMQAIARLGMTPGAFRVAVHRLRRRYRELVRAEIAETLPEGGNVAEEMDHLVRALGAGAS